MQKGILKGTKKENIQSLNRYRLAYMFRGFPHNKIKKLINILEEYSQKSSPKNYRVTGDYKKDLPGLKAMCLWLSVVDKVYGMYANEKRTEIKPDVCEMSSGLFLKVAEGCASYVKMTPKNKEKFKEISFSKQAQKSLAISTKMRQNIQY